MHSHSAEKAFEPVNPWGRPTQVDLSKFEVQTTKPRDAHQEFGRGLPAPLVIRLPLPRETGGPLDVFSRPSRNGEFAVLGERLGLVGRGAGGDNARPAPPTAS
jgi:hypothetical protein